MASATRGRYCCLEGNGNQRASAPKDAEARCFLPGLPASFLETKPGRSVRPEHVSPPRCRLPRASLQRPQDEHPGAVSFARAILRRTATLLTNISDFGIDVSTGVCVQ